MSIGFDPGCSAKKLNLFRGMLGMSLLPIILPKIAINGAKADQKALSGATLRPLSTLTIDDPDPQRNMSVTVTLSTEDYSDPGNVFGGTLKPDTLATTINLPLNVPIVYAPKGSTFKVQGNAAFVTFVLQRLEVSFAGAGPSPAVGVTHFSIEARDDQGLGAADVTTSVITSAQPIVPSLKIMNTQAGQQFSSGQTITPFSRAFVLDSDPAAIITATLTIKSFDLTLVGTGIGRQFNNSVPSKIVDPLASTSGSINNNDFPTPAYTIITGPEDYVANALKFLEVTFPATQVRGNVTESVATLTVTDTNGATATDSGTTVFSSYPVTPTSVYRFFDTKFGTHFFTSDPAERDAIQASRADLTEETNNFGSVGYGSPNSESVYRFFDTANGTHFFTASNGEKNTTIDTRPDLTWEPTATFFEHSTQQIGDVAVYRFFDTQFGTHFYTGDANEEKALVTPGTSGFRADLKFEGIEFYAPAGTFV